ncbi:hypothetical protein [Motiliproteus sp. MSK22-1]|uniref:hypothetical protein n=1 Tax=Motiliproteus sp. MSK22-1 TaxID=1897630 RepID=UPI00118001B6|nr:hypothetical protein [Motiliproteus sp. MSK22-1]
MVKIGVVFLALAKGLDINKDEQLRTDLDFYIPKVLGVGHSLYSCLQFSEGKKGRVIFKELEQKLLETSDTAGM